MRSGSALGLDAALAVRDRSLPVLPGSVVGIFRGGGSV